MQTAIYWVTIIGHFTIYARPIIISINYLLKNRDFYIAKSPVIDHLH